MDRREFKAQFKILEDTDSVGSFEGIAAVFSNVDRQSEIILPGAFTRTLEDFVKRGFLASGHDWKVLAGTIGEAYETKSGLFVRGDFHSTPDAQELRKVIRERLERGKDVAMSIGYQIVDDEFDSQKSVRMLKEIELFEVSVVSVPANPLARVTSVKDMPSFSGVVPGVVQLPSISVGTMTDPPKNTFSVTYSGSTFPQKQSEAEEVIEARRIEMRRLYMAHLARAASE